MLVGKLTDVNITGSTQDVLAAVTGKKIALVSGILTAGAAGASFKFQSGASTDKSGVFVLAAGTPLVLPVVENGYLRTTTSEKLNLVVSAGALTGVVTVQEIT